MLWNSMGSLATPKAITSPLTALHLPCGMAMPEPMPVLRVFSRAKTASRTVWRFWSRLFSSRRFTSSVMTASFLVLASGTLTQAGCNICVRIMLTTTKEKNVGTL